MQSLRFVFNRGRRSMGSHQARYFSSPPGSSASNVAARYLLRGITVAGAYAIAPYISRQEAVDLKLEGKRNEILRDLDEFYEQSEKYWSDMLDRRNLRKRPTRLEWHVQGRQLIWRLIPTGHVDDVDDVD